MGWTGITDRDDHRANVLPDGSVQVMSTPSTLPLFMIPLHKKLGETTLASPGVMDEYTITLTSATGFVDKSMVIITDCDNIQIYIGCQVGAAVGDTITLDRPLDNNYATGLVVTNNSCDASVDGSITTQTFGLRRGIDPNLQIIVDVTRVMLSIYTVTTPTLAKFGDIAKLTNGVTLRKRDGNRVNLFNLKDNGDFASIAYDMQFLTAIGGGQDGVTGRLTFTKMGGVVRAAPDEDLELLVNDDLTGLTELKIVAEGQIVIPET